MLSRFVSMVVVLLTFASPAWAQQESGSELDRPSVAGEPTAVPSGYETAGAGELDESELTFAEVRVRLSWLDATWATLASTGGPNWGSAIPAFVFGAIYIGAGIALQVSGPPYDASAPYLYAFGAISIVRPIAGLLLTPNPTDPANHYLSMPRDTLEEAAAQMRYGENELESFASDYFLMRVVSASVNMASGVGLGVGFIAFSGVSFDSAFSYLLLLAPAVSIVTGLIQLFTTSAVEQRWDAYVKMRTALRERATRHARDADDDLLSTAPPTAPSISFGVGPGGVSLYGSF